MKPLEQLSEVATRVSELPLDAGEVALAVRVPPSNSNPGTEVGSVGYALSLMLDNVILESIVEAHGGKVTVPSQQGRTQFTSRLTDAVIYTS